MQTMNINIYVYRPTDTTMHTAAFTSTVPLLSQDRCHYAVNQILFRQLDLPLFTQQTRHFTAKHGV